MTQLTIPTPQTPWAISIKQRLNTAGLIALGALLAGVAVKTTGLNVKLGFAASFFLISTLLFYIVYCKTLKVLLKSWAFLRNQLEPICSGTLRFL